MRHLGAQYPVIGLGHVIIKMRTGHITGPDSEHGPGSPETKQEKHRQVETQRRHTVVRYYEHAHRLDDIPEETGQSSQPHASIL